MGGGRQERDGHGPNRGAHAPAPRHARAHGSAGARPCGRPVRHVLRRTGPHGVQVRATGYQVHARRGHRRLRGVRCVLRLAVEKSDSCGWHRYPPSPCLPRAARCWVQRASPPARCGCMEQRAACTWIWMAGTWRWRSNQVGSAEAVQATLPPASLATHSLLPCALPAAGWPVTCRGGPHAGGRRASRAPRLLAGGAGVGQRHQVRPAMSRDGCAGLVGCRLWPSWHAGADSSQPEALS